MGAAAAVPCHDSAHGSRAPQYHSSDSRQLEKKHNTRANTGQLAYYPAPRTPHPHPATITALPGARAIAGGV